METDIYFDIIKVLAATDSLKEFERTGFCRAWSGNALRVIKTVAGEKQFKLLVEAREVYLEPSFSHTFLRLLADGQEAFIIDSIGTEKFPPFVGFENDAPDHLQNSRHDMINYYV